MTLIYKPLYILKMYLHVQNKISRTRVSKVRAIEPPQVNDTCDRTYCHAAFFSGFRTLGVWTNGAPAEIEVGAFSLKI